MKTKKGQVVVRISGGLGNQMFRHAAALSLAQRTGRTLVYDLTDFLIFHGRAYQMRQFAGPSRTPHWGALNSGLYLLAYVVYKRVSARLFPVLLRAMNVLRLEEKSPWLFERAFADPAIGESKQILYVDGNCQHLDYLPDDATLRREFQFSNPPRERNLRWLTRIEQAASVSVHIRRSDYLVTPGCSVLGLDYYRRAAELVRAREPSPLWVVFSDDIAWCRQNLGLEGETLFVEGNEAEPWEDLRLMAACRHHVIANSTFSWWGACLGRVPDGVTVAPEMWLENIPTASCLLRAGWGTAPSF